MITERAARACIAAWRTLLRPWLGRGTFLVALGALGVLVWRITPGENRAFNAFLAAMVGGTLLLSAAQLWFARQQLRLSEREQARVEDEEAQLPHVKIGLGPDCISRLVLHPEWQLDHDYSQPLTVPLTVVNEGPRAAQGLLYNLLVPHPVRNAMTSYFLGGIHVGKHPPEGFTQFICRTSGLQPGVRDVQDTLLAFPRGSASYACPFTLHVEDLFPVPGELCIEVVDDRYPAAAEEPSA